MLHKHIFLKINDHNFCHVSFIRQIKFAVCILYVSWIELGKVSEENERAYQGSKKTSYASKFVRGRDESKEREQVKIRTL